MQLDQLAIATAIVRKANMELGMRKMRGASMEEEPEGDEEERR